MSQKKKRIKSGPTRVIWIKVVTDPVSNDKRAYFETADPTNPHGYFILDGSVTSNGYLTALTTAFINGANISYTPTASAADDTDYTNSDSFKRPVTGLGHSIAIPVLSPNVPFLKSTIP